MTVEYKLEIYDPILTRHGPLSKKSFLQYHASPVAMLHQHDMAKYTRRLYRKATMVVVRGRC